MNNRHRIWFIGIFLLLILPYLSAQEDIELPKELTVKTSKEKHKKTNFIVGGYFGATFGSTTCIDFSPHGAYYLIKDHLALGIGINYTYYMEYYASNYYYNAHVLGGSVYLQGYFLRFLCAHAEFNCYGYRDSYQNQWLTVPGVYIGGGYRQKIGQSLSIYGLILFNCMTGYSNNIYGNPILRVGVDFDL